jgi:hypothetical protein
MARKRHICCECRAPIQPGQAYEIQTGQWNRGKDIYRFKTCALCVEIRNHFSCGNGWYFRCVWDDLREGAFENLRFECLKGLSVAAREKVLAEWRRWKGLEA